MSEVRELHPKKPETAKERRLAMVGRVIVFTLFAAVTVPALLAAVYGSSWVSVWLIHAIGRVF